MFSYLIITFCVHILESSGGSRLQLNIDIFFI